MSVTSAPSPPSFTAILALPCCKLGIREALGQGIQELVFLPPDTPLVAPASSLTQQVSIEIERYFNNPLHILAFPLINRGTPFQRRVWKAISTIPVGQTAFYSTLAQSLDNVPRAVGQACGANPFPLIVPCHRVVSQQGIGGFAHASDGWLITTKRWLLTHEGVI